MQKSLAVALFLLVFLTLPNIVWAGFFNDGNWYMDSSLWVEIADGDPEGRGTLTDSNDRLNWVTTPGWSDDYRAFVCYGSTWIFDLDDDFEFTLDFHYDHTGTFDTDEGSVEVGLAYYTPPAPEPSHIFSLEAMNQVIGATNYDRFWVAKKTPGEDDDGWWARTANDGRFYVYYDSLADILHFQSLIGGEGGIEYEGLRDTLGLAGLHLYFAGWSDGAALDTDEAYLHDFEVTQGTMIMAMIPEIPSLVLLISGLLGLAVAGKSRKNKVVE